MNKILFLNLPYKFDIEQADGRKKQNQEHYTTLTG
jgi:hypothetical protein